MKRFILFFFISLISQNLLSQEIQELNKYLFNSNFRDAAEIGEKLIKKFPENAEFYYKCGLAYQMLNKNQKAENKLYKAYFLDSLNTNIINACAKISEINSNKTKSISLYQKTLEIDSLNFTALNSLSRLLYLNKKYKKAINIFKILSKQDSLNPYYYRKIGLCYIKLNDAKTGLKFYRKAYLKDTTNILNIKTLASIYLNGGKFDKAIEICNKGIETDSTYSSFYEIKANAYFAKNHFYRAIPVYKKTMQLGDSSYNVLKRLGMSLYETKKYKEALHYNIAVYNIDSSSYSNTDYLCRNYLALKQYDKSLKFAEKTLDLLTFAKYLKYDIYGNMAKIYTKKKDYKNALKMYKKQKKNSMYDVESGYFDLYNTYQTALIYDKLNDKRNALTSFQKIVNYFTKRHSTDYDNPYLKYSKQRITKLKEDLFFQGK